MPSRAHPVNEVPPGSLPAAGHGSWPRDAYPAVTARVVWPGGVVERLRGTAWSWCTLPDGVVVQVLVVFGVGAQRPCWWRREDVEPQG